jgi:hypothetical protein
LRGPIIRIGLLPPDRRMPALHPQQLRQPFGQHLERDHGPELAPWRPALLGEHHGVLTFRVVLAFEED